MAVKGNSFSSMSDPLKSRSVSGAPAKQAKMEVFKKGGGKFFTNTGFKNQQKLSSQNVSKSVN